MIHVGRDPLGLGKLEEGTVDRRDFMKIFAAAAAAVGLPASAAVKMAAAAEAGLKPSVIWLHFQECTGCTESLLRTSQPGLGELILDLISLDYHETLFAAAGYQIEDALHQAMHQHKGKYVCVVEGSIPVKDNGVYCKVGGRTAIDILNEVAADAAAVIALGSCASWGGVQSSGPNPTGATGAPEILKGQPVVTVPGCPANPYNFLGVVMHFLTTGGLPDLDDKGRPLFAYGKTVHDNCARRPHFDAGRFADEFGDEGHRKGWCLYRLGCKGPQTHANCATLPFSEMAGTWPIGVGHPCVGCTEKQHGFTTAIHDVIPPAEVGLAEESIGEKSGLPLNVAGIAGVAAGVAAGVGLAAGRRSTSEDDE